MDIFQSMGGAFPIHTHQASLLVSGRGVTGVLIFCCRVHGSV
jgi:hypothetical protein